MPYTSRPQEFKKVLARNVALPIVFGISLCAIFLFSIYRLSELNQWVDHTDQVLAKSNELLRSMSDTETMLRGFLLTGDADQLKDFNGTSAQVEARTKALADLVNDNPLQMTRMLEILSTFVKWEGEAAKAIGTRARGQGIDRSVMSNRASLMQACREGVFAFSDVEEGLKAKRVGDTNRGVLWIALITFIFSIGGGSILAIFGRKQLYTLSNSYEKTIQRSEEQAQVIQAQSWLESSRAEVGDTLRGSLEPYEIGERFLKVCAERIDLQLGAVYLQVENKYLDLVASYSFPGSALEAARRIEVGRGLVGQTAKDLKTKILTDIPADYYRIGSGLGDFAVTSILIFPIFLKGGLQAVVELAFRNTDSERALDFLKVTSETLALSFQTAAYQHSLQEYLRESQQLNEELQTQQEELKVSNEELTEQSRAILEAQSRLESQQVEMEQTNQQLEEQTRILEEQKDRLDVANQELVHKQEELSEHAHQLKLASDYKTEFLANMSHELRTPLNSSLILAKLLQENADGNLTAQQIEFAGSIYSAGNDLLALINDILDLSKVEAGMLDVEVKTFPIAKLVSRLQKNFEPVAKEKNLLFITEVDDKLPKDIETDSQRLEQILKNLLSNAFKFTKIGSVRLKIAPQKNGGVDGVEFAVIDTGLGVSQDQHQIIFEPFRQADGSQKREFGGTGLGLSISKSLAELLNGAISVDSELSKGSTFSLWLPLDASAKSRSKKLTAPPKKTAAALDVSGHKSRTTKSSHVGQTDALTAAPHFQDDRKQLIENPSQPSILIVEDDSKFAKVLYDLVRQMGYSAVVVDSGAQAILMAERFRPQAVCLDIRLSDELGFSVLDQLKHRSSTRHIPVYAISAGDYARESLNLGAAAFLTKPADRETLKRSLRKLIDKSKQRTKRILLVEDDPRQQESVRQLVGSEDVSIVAVATGADALDQLKQHAFDCMIMDLALPDISGFDLLATATDDEKILIPPVIVYTGRSLSKAEEEKLEKYSRSIIIKGARSPERLLDEVSLFLHQPEEKMSPERQKILRESRNREKAFEGTKILLVDDDVRNIFALTSALETKGALVRIARNGLESLERLKAEDDIGLVLMDIMMPVMDGYQAMKEIRKNPAWKNLPIIGVTAKAMPDDQAKCLDAGANDYLSKPIDLPKLMSLMRVWLRHRTSEV